MRKARRAVAVFLVALTLSVTLSMGPSAAAAPVTAQAPRTTQILPQNYPPDCIIIEIIISILNLFLGIDIQIPERCGGGNSLAGGQASFFLDNQFMGSAPLTDGGRAHARFRIPRATTAGRHRLLVDVPGMGQFTRQINIPRAALLRSRSLGGSRFSSRRFNLGSFNLGSFNLGSVNSGRSLNFARLLRTRRASESSPAGFIVWGVLLLAVIAPFAIARRRRVQPAGLPRAKAQEPASRMQPTSEIPFVDTSSFMPTKAHAPTRTSSTQTDISPAAFNSGPEDDRRI